MSHTGFQWSDEQAQAPPAVKAQGSAQFAWSDEQPSQKTNAAPLPNAGLAPPAGGPGSFPVEEDRPFAGKLQGLPGVHPHDPTFQEGKSDLILASAPLAATMGVPRIIGSAIGAYVGDKGGRFLAEKLHGGDTAQEIAGDVGGLVGGGIGAHRIGGGIERASVPIGEAIRGPAPVFPGAPLPATPAPEVLNPSLVSESRTLPGQVGKEVVGRPAVSPPIASAEPLPARPGLALPPAPEAAAPAVTQSPLGAKSLGQIAFEQNHPIEEFSSGMSPDAERAWQESHGFKTEPVIDIGAKVRSAMPAMPRIGGAGSLGQSLEAPIAPANGKPADPWLERLRARADAIAQEKSTPPPNQDLTRSLRKSVKVVEQAKQSGESPIEALSKQRKPIPRRKSAD